MNPARPGLGADTVTDEPEGEGEGAAPGPSRRRSGGGPTWSPSDPLGGAAAAAAAALDDDVRRLDLAARYHRYFGEDPDEAAAAATAFTGPGWAPSRVGTPGPGQYETGPPAGLNAFRRPGPGAAPPAVVYAAAVAGVACP